MSIKTKVSIGLPVYNGEQFIHKRLENILSQTFQDFEIIISVDPSDDLTQQICLKFSKKDKRIKLFEQNKRMGWVWSFTFVAKKAIGKYFVWAASDDLWSSDFLEKHVVVLESDKKLVACTCIFSFFGNLGNSFVNKTGDSLTTKIYKKIRRSFRTWGNIPIEANSYESRAEICLRNFAYFPYAVFRTKDIKQSLMAEHFVWDWSVCMNVLKFGNLHLINKKLYQLYWDESTSTRKSLFHQFKIQNTRLNEYFFPYSSYTYWCIKNVGSKFFFRNFDFFVRLNFMGEVAIIKGLYLQFRNYFDKNNYKK